MTVSVPTSVASVVIHASGGLVDHTHVPGDRPDLDSADGWAIQCSPVCERAIVSGFDGWADGFAKVIEGDGRVDVYGPGITVLPEEAEALAEMDAPADPVVPILNFTLPSITVNTPKQKRPKRQKRHKVTVEATVESPSVTVQPQITIAQPLPRSRRTSVRRRRDGTMIVQSEPNP